MPNRLANENSPYLLQHAENAVEWYPWGEEALEKARSEDKPIFLSVGYAACHWCHVMAHESFEDEDTAAIMNEHFVNIKVDREERPDIDSIYMQAVVAMTRQGGWPMSVFLTPEGKPFYGGTYFPPVHRYNMPSFQEVLGSVARVWRQDRKGILESAQQITGYLQTAAETAQASGVLDLSALDQATTGLADGYDWANGGWGQAPKFPQPMVIEFLLRQATRGDQGALKMAEHALQAMARGGMYDVVGGGFARYCVDNNWLIPHFEKMLYDNAQLALVYIHAYMITRKALYRRVVEETLDFVIREMTHSLGGFYSSLDADSEGEEGKFYVWTPAEIQAALASPEDVKFVSAAYGVTAAGNFEGKTVLQRAIDDTQLAIEFGIPQDRVASKLTDLHAKMLSHRNRRIRPGTDDKVLVAWNGLMLVAFAEAGRYLKRPDYTAIATRNADFLLGTMHTGGRLLRSWRDGRAQHNAYLEDYAAFILGLVALYQTDPQTRWFTEANSLASEMVSHFRDPAGGFFDTRDDHPTLILRPKDTQDNAFPSGNALAAQALLQLATFTGDSNWFSLVEEMLQNMVATAARYPTSFGQWLSALDFAVGPAQEVAVLGAFDSPGTQSLLHVLWDQFRPRIAAVISEFPPDAEAPPLISGRTLLNGQPTAFVCQNFTCRLPVTDPGSFWSQLTAG